MVELLFCCGLLCLWISKKEWKFSLIISIFGEMLYVVALIVGLLQEWSLERLCMPLLLAILVLWQRSTK